MENPFHNWQGWMRRRGEIIKKLYWSAVVWANSWYWTIVYLVPVPASHSAQLKIKNNPLVSEKRQMGQKKATQTHLTISRKKQYCQTSHSIPFFYFSLNYFSLFSVFFLEKRIPYVGKLMYRARPMRSFSARYSSASGRAACDGTGSSKMFTCCEEPLA